jgi:ribosome-associated translation inhibitor RaiA
MHVDVALRGAVPRELAQEAAERISQLEHVTTGPLLHARVVLTQEANRSIELPARAEGELSLAGHDIRARVSAPVMWAAIDALAERLQAQLRRQIDRLVTRHHRPPEASPGEWRHGAWMPPRPARYPRPAGERRIIRRKTFAIEPTTAAEAAADMAALDHSFYLFRDIDSGADAVLYHRDDGRLSVIVPAGAPPAGRDDVPREPSRYSTPLELRTAVAEMDALDHRFLYFTDAETGRGCVLYLRYDGHYGLIEPAA